MKILVRMCARIGWSGPLLAEFEKQYAYLLKLFTFRLCYSSCYHQTEIKINKIFQSQCMVNRVSPLPQDDK